LEDLPLISDFRVSPETVAILKENGFERLFPIQSQSYDVVYDGTDIIGRARTGTGKVSNYN
jgi:ATP-dependent RNA helicase DDX21